MLLNEAKDFPHVLKARLLKQKQCDEWLEMNVLLGLKASIATRRYIYGFGSSHLNMQ